MPILLDSSQAPTLSELIKQANQVGLKYSFSAPELAESLLIQGIGSLANATTAEISFLSNPRLVSELSCTKAAAVILEPKTWEGLQAAKKPEFVAVVCDNPYALYALIAQWFDNQRISTIKNTIHSTAIIDPNAKIGANVSIGPYVVIESGVSIASGTTIGAHCTIGPNSQIGSNCTFHSNVTIYHNVQIGDRTILHSGSVIGADGFGFAPDPRVKHQAWVKIAQLGGVQIGNDVEIGANTTIDRGALDNTIIGDGVKLDNQIMIGHNATIGDHTAMAACVGVAGSTNIGKHCTIGGAAMLSGHLTLANNVHISGGTAVTSNITEPGRYTGVFPQAQHKDWQRNAAVISQLSTIRKRLRKLEGKS